MSVARQQAGIYMHGDKVVASPTHGGKIPVHGSTGSPKHGDPNLDVGTVVDVMAMIGESNTVGARNDLSTLPAGYFSADSLTKIWDDATSNSIVTLTPGPLEQQPGGAAYLDPAFTNTVGPCGSFAKRYRARNPSNELYFFINAQGGGRFSDLASRGRAANYLYNLSDGAYNEMKVSWNAFVAALAAAGKTPNVLGCRICLGGNTASDGTETANFQTDLTNLINQMRSQNVILGANTKVFIDRLGNQLTDTNATNRANIRAAQLAMAAGDPTKIQVFDTDGCAVVGVPDNIHWTAGAHALSGARLDNQVAGLFHPTKNIQAAGDAIYPLRQWLFNEANATISSGFVASVIDTITNAQTLAMGAGNRPAANTRTLSSGLVARHATWDGTDDYLLSGAPFMLNRAGGFIMGMHVKMAAVYNVAIIGEGHDSLSNPFWALKINASGQPCITGRNDVGTLWASLAALSSTAIADGNNHTFILTFDGSQFVGYVDGVAGGTPLSATPGTTTLQNLTIAAQKVGGSVSAFSPLNSGEINVFQYSSTGLSAFIANLHAYLSREFV